MRTLLLAIMAASYLISCHTAKVVSAKNNFRQGIFKRQESSEKLELKPDGTYTLYNPLQSYTPVFEQCEIASKGKWSVLSDDVFELTSEDKYLKQRGFEYELNKENKFWQYPKQIPAAILTA